MFVQRHSNVKGPTHTLATEFARALASSVLEQYDLRSVNALHLADALVLCDERTRDRAFVCFDEGLTEGPEGR